MRHLPRFSLSLLALSLAAALASTAQATDLMQVYEQARASDPQIAATEAQSRASAEGVVQSRAALLPNIAGNASLTNDEGSGSFGSPRPFTRPDGTLGYGSTTSTSDTRSRSFSVTLNQTIYDHRNYTRLKSSRALRSQSEATYQASLDALFIRVSTAYFNALTAKTNLEAAQAEEKAVKRQLEQADQRFEVGLTAITDVHEARAQYDGARARVIQARNQFDDAHEALAELTGGVVDEIKPLDETIPMSAPEPSDGEAWVQTALDRSPTLAARKFALASAEHNVSTARAGHYPTLSAQVQRSTGDTWGDANTNGVTQDSRSGNFGTTASVFLTVPIFEGLATQSGVRQQVANRDASADQLEQERRAIVRQVRNAYRAVIAGVSEVEARKQALVSAQSALEATQAGFEVGTRTIVDVLLSQQNLFAAQREYAAARHSFVVNGLTLKQLAGVIELKDLQQVNTLLVDAPAPVDEASDDNGKQ
jgi:outer membrane protein